MSSMPKGKAFYVNSPWTDLDDVQILRVLPPSETFRLEEDDDETDPFAVFLVDAEGNLLLRCKVRSSPAEHVRLPAFGKKHAWWPELVEGEMDWPVTAIGTAYFKLVRVQGKIMKYELDHVVFHEQKPGSEETGGSDLYRVLEQIKQQKERGLWKQTHEKWERQRRQIEQVIKADQLYREQVFRSAKRSS